jgi:hypothetical protein
MTAHTVQTVTVTSKEYRLKMPASADEVQDTINALVKSMAQAEYDSRNPVRVEVTAPGQYELVFSYELSRTAPA